MSLYLVALYMKSTLFGISLAAFLASAATAGDPPNLVINGNFASGDFTAWTQWGNTAFTNVETGGLPGYENYGHFGPMTSQGGIFQDINTVAGTRYHISFDIRSTDIPNAMFGSFDGTAFLHLGNINSYEWAHLNFEVDGSSFSNITELRFGFLNGPCWIDITNIYVGAVPAPGAIALLGLAGLVGRRRR